MPFTQNEMIKKFLWHEVRFGLTDNSGSLLWLCHCNLLVWLALYCGNNFEWDCSSPVHVNMSWILSFRKIIVLGVSHDHELNRKSTRDYSWGLYATETTSYSQHSTDCLITLILVRHTVGMCFFISFSQLIPSKTGLCWDNHTCFITACTGCHKTLSNFNIVATRLNPEACSTSTSVYTGTDAHCSWKLVLHICYLCLLRSRW